MAGDRKLRDLPAPSSSDDLRASVREGVERDLEGDGCEGGDRAGDGRQGEVLVGVGVLDFVGDLGVVLEIDVFSAAVALLWIGSLVWLPS